ncbi:hypothetical protein [Leucobacter japonicus]|uniref:hypothetical protein n=1 Tax=Leucobacter japonicus TaxID=1461259 RepID=UPI0006A7846B|nr:hypothetical protein [Leucobacter japonicus]
MDLIPTIGGWGLAIVVALIALLPRKGTIENTRLDQLQEDLAAERERGNKQAERIDMIELNLTKYQKRDIAWARHYAMIQHGVETGTIPPWPELPEALRSDQ